MKRPAVFQIAGGLVAITVLMAGTVELQALRERIYPTGDDREDALYITSGPALRRISIAMNALAADLYWIRTIQYFGGTRRRLIEEAQIAPPPPALALATDYDQLYPMLDVTTSLDPRFKIAYRFGAVFLAESYPAGPGRPDLAIRLLEKGLREQPDKWEYLEDIGFVRYWYGHDYRGAAQAFQRASEIAGAPWWLRSLAATTLAQGGDRESSRTMWRAIRESAEIDWLRHDADRRLSQLDVLDQIDQLQRVIDRYTRANGHVPPDWLTLARAGVIRGVPLDPSHVAYQLNPDGRVTLAESSPLWPLPEEPARGAPSSGS
jgi:tetratricopeptide (TPR) repeat protein